MTQNLIRFDIIFYHQHQRGSPCAPPITNDDALYQQALEMAGAGIAKSDIVREAMKSCVRVQAVKRLVTLEEASPAMEDVPRRRPEPTS